MSQITEQAFGTYVEKIPLTRGAKGSSKSSPIRFHFDNCS